MVKLAGPLLSLEAQGSIGKVLTYKKGKTGAVARKYNRPHKKITGSQWTQRHIIGMITARWQVMSPAEKAPYIAKAKLESTPMTGFNYFVKVANADLKTYLGLILYLPMNETTGEMVNDYSGQGNNGTLLPTYPTDCPRRESSFIPQYGNALKFDGDNNYIECGISGSLELTNELTLEMWVKAAEVNDTTNNGIMFGNYPNTPNFDFTIVTRGRLRFYWNSGERNFYGTKDLRGAWHYLTAVRDKLADTIKIYIDGVYEMGGTAGTNRDFQWPFRIGSDYRIPISKRFNGVLDEVKLYNRALSLAEIKKHYDLLRLNKKRQPSLIS